MYRYTAERRKVIGVTWTSRKESGEKGKEKTYEVYEARTFDRKQREGEIGQRLRKMDRNSAQNLFFQTIL